MLPQSMKLYSIIFIVIQSCFLLTKSNPPPLAPALYVFGDSLLDNGNNNMLLTSARANYAPYSLDFPPPVHLGRFTNGRTTVDFLAEYLRLPYVPPYASLLGQNNMGLSNSFPNYINIFRPDSFGGYNYASASCGILPETGLDLGKCYSFDEQIGMFEKTVESQLSQMYKDPTQIAEHLSKSIFVVGVGTNDYLNNYFVLTSLRTPFYSPSRFAQLLIDTLSLQLKRLYDLGARKIVVGDVGPLGCIPTGVRLVTLDNPEGQCDEAANDILLIFNSYLPSLVQNLTYNLKGSHFILAPTYSAFRHILSYPLEYGFINSSEPCCQTYNGKLLCIPNTSACSTPNKYVFWDGYHPSEAVHALLAEQFFYGSSLCSPINVNDLVKL